MVLMTDICFSFHVGCGNRADDKRRRTSRACTRRAATQWRTALARLRGRRGVVVLASRFLWLMKGGNGLLGTMRLACKTRLSQLTRPRRQAEHYASIPAGKPDPAYRKRCPFGLSTLGASPSLFGMSACGELRESHSPVPGRPKPRKGFQGLDLLVLMPK